MMPTVLTAELRNAVRGLARTPSVTIAAILCIALGIGATTAVASAIDQALFHALPLGDADRLVAVHRVTPNSGPNGTWPQSPANYVDLAREIRSVQSLSALTSGTALVDLGSETVQASQLYVTGGMFPMLGAHAEAGRLLLPDDDRDDAPLVAVFSDEFWRTRFGGDRFVIGRTISIDGAPTTVVGILPPEFRIPHGGNLWSADVWMPLRFTPQQLAIRRSNYLSLLGRLAPGATVEQADAEVRQLFERLVEQHPELRGEGMRAAPLRKENLAGVRTPLLLIFGAVTMVLLIAATNVAALLLARGVQRRREMAVRVALGAGRRQAMRPAMVESLVISVIGAALGLMLAWAGVRTIGALAAARMPQLAGLGMDGRIVGFALLLTLLVAIVCAAAPAWRNASVDPQDALRGGRGGGSGRAEHRALRTLVVGEIALSLVLTTGAGLVLRAFASLMAKDPGFETSHVLTMNVTVAASRYQRQGQATTARDFLDPVLESIRALPGVEAAAAISSMPYVSWGNNSNIRYEGMPKDDPTRQPLVEIRRATPGFFAVTGQRLLGGRLLQASDDERPESPPVVVVNEALAKRDFPGKDVVGRRFYLDDTTFATVVGVVSDVRNAGPVQDPQPEMYWTYRQASSGAARFPLMIRTRGEPTAVAASVRNAIHAIDRTAAVADVAPMPEVIARSLGRPRFYFSLLGTFAAIAVILSATGLYGVLSYVAAQRTRELGIRVALGSTRRGLVRLVTGDGLRLVVIGLVVGMLAALELTRLMTAMLYGVSPLDPLAWVLAVVGMLVVATGATLVPALRASRVSPAISMRVE
jgi:putative ABC transport system permease protein